MEPFAWLPHVSQRPGKLIQETLEFSNRIHVAKVWPAKTPSEPDESIIILAHDQGITIVRRCQIQTRRFIFTDESGFTMIPDPSQHNTTTNNRSGNRMRYIPSDVSIPKVTNLALPPLPVTLLSGRLLNVPKCLAESLVFAAVCADNKIRVIKFNSGNNILTDKVVIAEIETAFPVTAIALTWVINADDIENFELLVAFAEDNRRKLSVARLPLAFENKRYEVSTEILLRRPVMVLDFQNTNPHIVIAAALLIGHNDGSASILDVYASLNGIRSINDKSFLAPFASQSPDNTTYAPDIIQRKRILDAKWISNGRRVLILLEDSQWGVWDVQDKNINTFSVYGYLRGDKHTPMPARNALTPMTPETRATSSANFFSNAEHPKPTQPPSSGVISIHTFPTPSGEATDDSALLHYNDTTYTIPSISALLTGIAKQNTIESLHNPRKSMTLNVGGTLYGPGLAKLDGCNLFGERITSASILHFQSPSAVGAKSMAPERLEIVTTGEFRIAFLAPKPSKAKDANAQWRKSYTLPRLDITLLDAGDRKELIHSDMVIDSANDGEARSKAATFAGTTMRVESQSPSSVKKVSFRELY